MQLLVRTTWQQSGVVERTISTNFSWELSQTSTVEDKHLITSTLAPTTLEHVATPAPVQDTLDQANIKLMPRSAVVPEGHSLQVTCASAQLLRHQMENAPYMTFELPSMTQVLEQKVSVILRPGKKGPFQIEDFHAIIS